MADKYQNFYALREAVPPCHYKITREDKGSLIVIAGPHGGGIEPGTSEITRAIASEDLSYYLFEGVKKNNNCDLHITSTNFDEPQCLELLKKAETAITVHGAGGDDKIVYLGGRDQDRQENIKNALKRRGFLVKKHIDINMQGTCPKNICNFGRSCEGVQLELTKGLRRTFFKSLNCEGRKTRTERFREFCAGIREGLGVVV